MAAPAPATPQDEIRDLAQLGVESVNAGSLEQELQRAADEKIRHEAIFGSRKQRELIARRQVVERELSKLKHVLANTDTAEDDLRSDIQRAIVNKARQIAAISAEYDSMVRRNVRREEERARGEAGFEMILQGRKGEELEDDGTAAAAAGKSGSGGHGSGAVVAAAANEVAASRSAATAAGVQNEQRSLQTPSLHLFTSASKRRKLSEPAESEDMGSVNARQEEAAEVDDDEDAMVDIETLEPTESKRPQSKFSSSTIRAQHAVPTPPATAPVLRSQSRRTNDKTSGEEEEEDLVLVDDTRGGDNAAEAELDEEAEEVVVAEEEDELLLPARRSVTERDDYDDDAWADRLVQIADADSDGDGDDDIDHGATASQGEEGAQRSRRRLRKTKPTSAQQAQERYKTLGRDANHPGSVYRIREALFNKMLEHQQVCVRWLWELHQQRCGGIVGDEMGLGKTIEVAAFLDGLRSSHLLATDEASGGGGGGNAASSRYDNDSGSDEDDDQYRPRRKRPSRANRTTKTRTANDTNGPLPAPILIVCPATMMQQWLRELHRWTPHFRVFLYHQSSFAAGASAALSPSGGGGRAVDGEEALHRIWHKCVAEPPASSEHPHVMITTYDMVRNHATDLVSGDRAPAWKYVVLDEGHKLRNPSAAITATCKLFQTPHRLLMTGAPIQNNLMELWSLFDFVFPGKLGTQDAFESQFAIPIQRGGYANASAMQARAAYKCALVLRDLIKPYLLRRLKKDVNIALPGKNEQILFCRLTDTQRQEYRAFLTSKDARLIYAGKKNMLYGVDQLRKICNHTWLLRLDHGASELHDVDSPPSLAQLVDGSAKLNVLRHLLCMWRREPRNKVLVFAQTRQMLDIIEVMLQLHLNDDDDDAADDDDLDATNTNRSRNRRKQQWQQQQQKQQQKRFNYLRMDGATTIARRTNLIHTFNTAPSHEAYIFLLTTRVGGLGINLTAANKVVIVDPDWNPVTDMQARERAYRIGQTQAVTIYRLITSGTIEEKIYHRQIFKQYLTNRVLQNPAQTRALFKTRDLQDLFALEEEKQKQEQEEKGEVQRNAGTDFTGNSGRVADTSVATATHRLLGHFEQQSTASSASKPAAAALSSRSRSRSSDGARHRHHRDAAGGGAEGGSSLRGKAHPRSRHLAPNDDDDEDNRDDKPDSNGEQDDAGLLEGLMGSGLHSRISHDRVTGEGVDSDAAAGRNLLFTVYELEASKIAAAAARRLRESRERSAATSLISSPSPSPSSWSGARRFGAVSKLTSLPTSTDISSPSTSTTPSSLHLENAAERAQPQAGLVALPTAAAELPSSQLIQSARSKSLSTATASQQDQLIQEIYDYIRAAGGAVSTGNLVSHFKHKVVGVESMMIFKNMLKQIAIFSADSKQWQML